MSDRRAPADRRKSADRRKTSEARQVAIEICNSVLRMALIHRSNGKSPDTVVTRELIWRKESTTLHSEAGARELLDTFRQLVAEEKLTGARIRLTLGGAFCVTRVLTGTADDVRRELSQLEDRSQLYLSLGPGRKALAGCVRPIDARHQHALLTVANQKTLDTLVHIGETVGVTIESIEPSLVALSRVIERMPGLGQESCLVIHLDNETAELGICHQGMLLLDYRPGGVGSTELVAAVLGQHMSRLQRYCDRHFSFVGSKVTRALLCGPEQLLAKSLAAFEGKTNLDVEVLDPQRIEAKWKFVGDSPQSDMAAALGTALTLGRTEADLSSPNLMEHLLAQSREPVRPFLIKSLLPVAAMLALVAACFWLNLRERRELEQMRGRVAELRPAQLRATELRLTLVKTDKLLNHLAQIENRTSPLVLGQLVHTIGQCMPDDVWLDRLTVSDNAEISLVGESFADTGIYEFVRWLQRAPGLDKVALQGTRSAQTIDGPTTNFDIEMLLANHAAFNKTVENHD